MLVTQFIVVADVAASVRFYSEVLGGTVISATAPGMVKLSNSWIIINTGGPPTIDKPATTLVVPDATGTVSAFMDLRVADIDRCYAEWSRRGARFLTGPIRGEHEIRCYMADPDGHLIEVGQSL